MLRRGGAASTEKGRLFVPPLLVGADIDRTPARRSRNVDWRGSNVEGGGARGQHAHPYEYGLGSGDRTKSPQQVVAAGKTGTKLADIPGSIQTAPHQLLDEQAATCSAKAGTTPAA
jgi:hypothetical protein